MSSDSPLRERVADPGFTPAIRDANALLDLLNEGDEALTAHLERALLRVGAPLVPVVLQRLTSELGPARAGLVRILGRLPGQEIEEHLLRLATTDSGKSRRVAIAALGANRSARAEQALVALWKTGISVDDQRAVVRTLSKVGGSPSLALLSTINSDDPELARLLANAKTSLSRTLTRQEPVEIDLSRRPSSSLPIVLFARDGIEEITVEEAARFDAEKDARGRIRATLREAPEALFELRTMLRFGFPLPPLPLTPNSDLATVLAEMLTSNEAREIFSTFTKGRKSFRIAWADGGHRRSVVWACAKMVAERAPDLINDPSESAWEALVRPFERQLVCDLIPRRIADTRFQYRATDVPGSSHPTVAAALAYIAGVREGDVVWDPFVGSGTELVERAKLGAFKELVGTDVSEKAIRSAETNLGAASVKARLVLADATQFSGVLPTTILTNPPLGRRVLLGENREVVRRFLSHAAQVLAKGGQLVWVSPDPVGLGKHLKSLGMALEISQPFDMGGFSAVIERWRKM